MAAGSSGVVRDGSSARRLGMRDRDVRCLARSACRDVLARSRSCVRGGAGRRARTVLAWARDGGRGSCPQRRLLFGRPGPRAWTLAGIRASAGRGASGGRCRDGAARARSTQDGRGGRDQGGADRDQGDLAVRRASGGDHSDGGCRDRRDGQSRRLRLPVSAPRRRPGRRRPRPAGRRRPRPGQGRIAAAAHPPCVLRPRSGSLAGRVFEHDRLLMLRTGRGSAAVVVPRWPGVPGDHHTCRPTGGPTELHRARRLSPRSPLRTGRHGWPVLEAGQRRRCGGLLLGLGQPTADSVA